MPSTPDPIALVWFREDLRLADNPALHAAQRSGRPLALLYVLDDESEGIRPLGGAARWWLGRALAALAEAVEAKGGRLILKRGKAADLVPALANELGAGAVYWNRRYGAAETAVDHTVEAKLAQQDVAVQSFCGSLLHEPWTVKTKVGSPFPVFGPFFRSAAQADIRPVLKQGRSWHFAKVPAGDDFKDWKLEPTSPDWAGGLRERWTPGEEGARETLAAFVDDQLRGYATKRNRPDLDHSSRLSPYLRFGHVSPHQVLAAVRHAGDASDAPPGDVEKFVSELYWREFSYHLLFHLSDLGCVNFNHRFDRFDWHRDERLERAWQRGLTGYPIVDAGMRQLWQTGWMHNRVRMLVASFLVKHGLIDWRHGEAWFWETLVDADPANNVVNWQWVAGSGPDASPYFRIFNPVTQGETFDPQGNYVRRFVPELARMPARLIHRPWEAPPEVLSHAGVRLGDTYPRPIVDHVAARQRALDHYAAIRGD